MPDQADPLRQLASHAPAACAAWPRPPIVAVTGGRVGVGATTVAVNLGAALADAGLRVVIVDAATQHANLVEVAGVHLRCAGGLAEVLAGSRSVTGALQPGPGGALLLANGPGSNCEPDASRRGQQRLLTELQKLTSGTDAIIVDTGSGVTPWTRRFWQRARLVLVVTTEDDAGIKDTYATIKLAAADQLDTELRLLVNRAEQPKRAEEAHRRLSAACRRFLQRELSAVPYVPLHGEERAVSKAAPRVWENPNTPFGHAVLWLGRAVTDMLATTAPAPLAA